MAEYLDKTGLKYFWGKIKDKIPGPLQAYPVGSIYMSISSSFNPNTSFGGTWSKIAEGQCLIQAGSTYTLGSTGGKAKSYITEQNLSGNVTISRQTKKYGSHAEWKQFTPSDWAVDAIRDTGNPHGQPLDTMPPYLAVNIWERTA